MYTGKMFYKFQRFKMYQNKLNHELRIQNKITHNLRRNSYFT